VNLVELQQLKFKLGCMELHVYSEVKYNPAGGCVQLPIVHKW
jgi:hypothetical protein